MDHDPSTGTNKGEPKMNRKHETSIAVLCGTLLLASAALAAHPLVTDDAGTVGTGNTLVELNAQYDRNSYEGIKERSHELEVALTYGVSENVDLVVAAPYTSWSSRSDADGKNSGNGIGDTSLDVKWRFYDQDDLNLALKPGLSLPTGNDDKGLGAGKTTWQFFFIGTQEVEPWAFHLNLGYIRNNNTADERENLWHASLAGEISLGEKLRLVANIGAERSPDKEASTHPAFLLGGLIYSLTDFCDLDFGIKTGLNHAEPDYSLLAGVALSF